MVDIDSLIGVSGTGSLAAISGIAVLLIIGFFAFSILGYFLKSIKWILWLIAAGLLIAGVYFIFA